MAKRGQGEGTIAYNEKTGLYCGRLTVGYNKDGGQKRKAFYDKKRSEVQKKMNAAKAELDKGIFIESSRMTVSAWLDIWLSEYKKRSIKNNTYRVIYDSVNRYIKPAFGRLKLDDLRGDVIQKLINDMTDKGYSHGVICRVYETIS